MIASIRILCVCLFVSVTGVVRSETILFGSGDNAFEIEFVKVGSPGNSMDVVTTIPFTEVTPLGAVDYVYFISKYEISRDMVERANTAGGLDISMGPPFDLGPSGASEPATTVSPYEAAFFVNWLNASNGYHDAYKFGSSQNWGRREDGFDPANPFRNRLAKFVLPSAHEWHKAAYYDPDANNGDGGYWDYATGSDGMPTPVGAGTDAGTVVYNNSDSNGPAIVTEAGGLSPYGVMGMSGNVAELQETAYDLENNNAMREPRVVRGGDWASSVADLRASSTSGFLEVGDDTARFVGFRVVMLPDAMPGDFDRDGQFSASDIDQLFEAVRSGSAGATYDVNNDELVDVQDIDRWVADVVRTNFGDADLNGSVEFADFLALSAAYEQPGGWASGDFDGNETVEFADFLVLSENFGKTRPSASVPEPTGLCFVVWGSFSLSGFRRRSWREHSGDTAFRSILGTQHFGDTAHAG